MQSFQSSSSLSYNNNQLPTPSTTTTQLANLQLGSSLTTTIMPIMPISTFNADLDTHVTFFDPCSLCGNKKRRSHQCFGNEPRKKLIFTPPIVPPIPPYQPTNNHTPIRSPVSSGLTENHSSEMLKTHFPSSPPLSANLGRLGSCSGSSTGSPASASKPPRPPAKVLNRSVSDITPLLEREQVKVLNRSASTPSPSSGKKILILSPEPTNGSGGAARVPASCSGSETTFEDSPVVNRLKKKMEKGLAEFVNKVFKEPDTEPDEREACQASGAEENVETEEVVEYYKLGSIKCSCGKILQFRCIPATE